LRIKKELHGLFSPHSSVDEKKCGIGNLNLVDKDNFAF